MKKFLLPLMSLFASISIFAQQGVNKGKIYTQEKILDGYIMVSTYEITPQKFSFSNDKNGHFTPVPEASIIKVEYEGGATFEKYFVSVPVISKNYVDRTKEDYGYPDNLFSGIVFVQKLIAGNFSLYHFNDQYGYSHFFYKTIKDTGLIYLPNKAFEEGGAIISEASFRNLVNFLIKSNNCTKAGNADRLEYAEYSMISIFKKINQCTGNETVVLKNTNKVRITAGGCLGVVSNLVSFPGDQNSKRQVVPVFGVFLSIAPKFNLKSTLLGLEITFHDYKSASDTLILNSTYTRVDHVKFPQIQLSGIFRFYLSNHSPNFFMEGGPLATIGINGELKKETFANHILDNTTTTSINSRIDFGFFAGFGVEINRISIQARYNMNISATPTANYFGAVAKVSIF